MWSLRDPRLDGYPFMSSPWPTLALCAAYLAFVGVAGPLFMRDRPAYRLKNALVAYNAAQVALSAWLVWGGVRAGWDGTYSFWCQPVDYGSSEKALLMVRVVWVYFFAKLVDLLDTIFFVLRKKVGQVTFLHVSHHLLMPLYMWPSTRYLPGGHVSLGGVLNSFVHVVMYAYYMLAAIGGPAGRWASSKKKLLTWLQLTQFVVVFAHNAQLLVTPWGAECDFPKSHAVVTLALMVFFIVMFANFYVQAYIRKEVRNGRGEVSVNGKAKST